MSSPVYTVVVDDRSPRITYSLGNWELDGAHEEFNGTTTLSTGFDSVATFNFTGTGIGVYMTVGIINVTAQQTQLHFMLDNNAVGTFTPTSSHNDTRHIQAFLSPVLPDESHTLIITRSDGIIADSRLFLDYLLYNTTSAGDADTTFFFDDTSPQIGYSRGWFPVDPSTNASSGANANILSTARSVGSSGGSLYFPFQGTSIAIYGKLPPSEAGMVTTASISFDDAPPIHMSKDSDGHVSNNNLFSAGSSTNPFSTYTNHSLSVVIPSGSPFTLDYILVTGPLTSGDETSESSPSLPTPTNHSGEHGLSQRAIAGITAGAGVALALLLVLTAILLCRRQKRYPSSKTKSTDSETNRIDPYNVYPTARAIPLEHPASTYSVFASRGADTRSQSMYDPITVVGTSHFGTEKVNIAKHEPDARGVFAPPPYSPGMAIR